MCSNTNGSNAIVEASVVRYELHPDGDGTLLRFTHRGLGVRNAAGFRPGTHAFLDRLEAHLAGDALARLDGSAIARSPIDFRRTHEGNTHVTQWFSHRAPTSAVAYHSGFGHTATLAEAVAAGAREPARGSSVIAVDTMTDSDWDTLDAADGILFGSATYMGNVSAAFQAFAERTGGAA